mgnify:CR=1 FL=1
MTPPPAVTDEELARVGEKAGEVARGRHQGFADRMWWLDIAPRLASEVRAGRLWRTLALALIASRARGNAPDVLAAVDALEQMGEHVPAVVKVP